VARAIFHECDYEKFFCHECSYSNSLFISVAIKTVTFMNVAKAIIFMNKVMKIMRSWMWPSILFAQENGYDKCFLSHALF
jgi:hypothetical protein